ncbi:MAG: tRNA (adenosine(37)-N6)-dimethylallyltransferase MiaA [Alphaproteobacteria bacterium]|nr:tRNA (adenosine(37)-N6)-dimethylallyltransferase MiaA [Alphaproteobacteria bacterium]
MKPKKALIICGPTSSGKSKLAMEYALKYQGAIINADSMQIYEDISILSSSPSKLDKDSFPHYLYNFLSAGISYNVARYLRDISITLNECLDRNLLPIITGGTGLYIQAIMCGISEIPEIRPEAKLEVERIRAKGGVEIMYEELRRHDPEAAFKLNARDSQRVARALEVILSSNISILEFHQKKTTPVLEAYVVETIYIKPERKQLYTECDAKFDMMIANGAIDEVASALDKYPNIHNGLTKILGFKHIASYLRGEISKIEAVNNAKKDTRNYAKRQYTWFNNQISWPHNILTP